MNISHFDRLSDRKNTVTEKTTVVEYSVTEPVVAELASAEPSVAELVSAEPSVAELVEAPKYRSN